MIRIMNFDSDNSIKIQCHSIPICIIGGFHTGIVPKNKLMLGIFAVLNIDKCTFYEICEHKFICK